MALHQLLANAAQMAPLRPAVQHRNRTATWEALRNRVARRAGALRAAGLQSGDRVGILAANVPEHLEADFAVSWAGLVLVPLNTRLSVAEQKHILEHADCAVLCHDERYARTAKELADKLPGLRAIALNPLEQWDDMRDPLAQQIEWPFTPVSPQAPAAIFYTGGTTGLPKGVELSHAALLIQGMSAKDNYDFDSETTFLHSAPMFHLADFAASLGAVAGIGCHTFLPDFSPAALLDAIEHEGSNALILVPTMVAGVLDAAIPRPGVLKRLRRILYGAAPIQEPLLRRLLNEAPGAGLVQVYGQTELGGACTVLPPEYHVLEGPRSGKLGSAGRCMPAFHVRIVDESGALCAPGQPGEVQISGPGLMTSYWKEPALSAAALQDGWLRTGDVGVLDADGFLSIVGRLKDMIISGGENVFAGEVESTLMYHPAVAAAAVIGVPHAKWGEAVHAVVVLKPGAVAGAEELITHCRERIAHYKCPLGITFRDALPLSGVGKVRKVELVEEWKHTMNSGASH